ncbi:MAG: hypothetical protein Q7J38_07755 [Gallionella sp.]|nr:hypothetical protein [Gallionella sp.]
MNIDFDKVEKLRKAKYKEACEGWDKLEKERLNKIFAELGSVESNCSFTKTRLHEILDFGKTCFSLKKIRNSVESGDRKAMLELLAILTDSLRLFETLPQEVRLAVADGLEKMQDNLKEAKGFLPRKRGEISKEVKRTREEKVLLTALEVESYRVELEINLDEAEANRPCRGGGYYTPELYPNHCQCFKRRASTEVH